MSVNNKFIKMQADLNTMDFFGLFQSHVKERETWKDIHDPIRRKKATRHKPNRP